MHESDPDADDEDYCDLIQHVLARLGEWFESRACGCLFHHKSSIKGKQLFPVIISTCAQFLEADDWRAHHAVFAALSGLSGPQLEFRSYPFLMTSFNLVMIEICTPIVRENIDIVAPAVFTHMQSTHVRVRYAACLVLMVSWN